jgi:hypothetical protein
VLLRAGLYRPKECSGSRGRGDGKDPPRSRNRRHALYVLGLAVKPLAFIGEAARQATRTRVELLGDCTVLDHEADGQTLKQDSSDDKCRLAVIGQLSIFAISGCLTRGFFQS